jgi:hypothetical protein
MTKFMSHLSPFTCAFAALLFVSLTAPHASAQSGPVIQDGGVTVEFPDRLTFTAHVESSAEIERVVLEYGVEKLTCGQVTAKAFPDFEPGVAADVSWTWEMLQSGSEPPGTRIWYRWRAIDAAGNESVSDEQRLIWIDDEHAWQSISRGQLTFHWYDGLRAFAQELLNSAADSLDRLGVTTGVAPESPIDMYIYASAADLRQAVLYEPGWTGGLAYADHNILIIGISPEQIDWGKKTEAHELTHVLVGHLTFSCLGSVPTWLNEGIAVYAEGELSAGSKKALQDAIDDDRLISVRALSGGFSEHPAQANLSYAQSYSLVNFLVEEYGADRLLALFRDLRDGMTIDDALTDVYGFGVEGLEDEWRASIGAQPRRAEGAAPTPTPLPTPVPTYRPISGVPLAAPVNATPAPPVSSASEPAAEQSDASAADGAQPEALLAAGLVVIATIVGVMALSARRRKGA